MSQEITATDFFCGAGGSSSGLVAAGFNVKGAANHWKLAIETHNTNHPNTTHYLDDLQQAHPSWYPRTTIAWFSPECTNHSLAKGKKRKGIGQLDLWGESKVDPSEEKSRATMREVVEFSAYHHYEAVIVENVVDIRNWQHYDAWLSAMLNMGYQHKILYLNAQFFGVPQSRDRFYAVFWKKGNKAPNLEFRPKATCAEHGLIDAVQVFKKTEFPWGRYGQRRQYVYRCPHCGSDVMPAYRPAADVIDWSLPSEKIGDRKTPLKEKTVQRILAGLKKFGNWPHVADLGHSHAEHSGKVHSVESPLSTETGQQRHALINPFLVQYYGRDEVKGWPVSELDDAIPTIRTQNTHALVQPFMLSYANQASPPRGTDDVLFAITKGYVTRLVVPPLLASVNYFDDRAVPVDQPLPTQTTANKNALVTPPFIMAHYNNAVYAAINQPMPTIPGINKHSLITPESVLPECGFRMLQPHELKRGMGFDESYIILGDKRNQIKQTGNAVCPPVAQIIAERVMESLQ